MHDKIENMHIAHMHGQNMPENMHVQKNDARKVPNMHVHMQDANAIALL